jgi:hypothetical protein
MNQFQRHETDAASVYVPMAVHLPPHANVSFPLKLPQPVRSHHSTCAFQSSLSALSWSPLSSVYSVSYVEVGRRFARQLRGYIYLFITNIYNETY